MNERTIERAQSLARDLAHALTALRCRGHVVDLPGCPEPDLREARRFVEIAVWISWRVPHVMLAPCALADEGPAVVLGTWDARGVAIHQTVTSRAGFVAEATRAAETLAARRSPDDLAMIEALYRDADEAPEMENLEFWPEILARVRESAADPVGPAEPDASVVGSIVAVLWPTRIEDLRERLRSIED